MRDIKESLVKNVGIGKGSLVDTYFKSCTNLKKNDDSYSFVYNRKDDEIQISQNMGFGFELVIDYEKYQKYFEGIKLFIDRTCSNVTIDKYYGKVADLISGSPKSIKFTNCEITLGAFAAQYMYFGYNTVIIDFKNAKFNCQNLTIDTSTLINNFGQMIGKSKYNINGHSQTVTYN